MTTSKQNIQFIDFYTYVMYTFTRHTSDLSSLSNWNLVFISVFQDNRVKKLKDSEVRAHALYFPVSCQNIHRYCRPTRHCDKHFYLVLATLCTNQSWQYNTTIVAYWETNPKFNAHFHLSRQFGAPCGLRGCKNRPAPFPGQMSYKATKPGLLCL